MRRTIATLVACAFVASLSPARAGILDVASGPKGSATISISGVPWLSTDDVGVFTQGSMQTASSGGLVAGAVSYTAGSDAYGEFNRTEQQWTIKATGEAFTTAIRNYTPNRDVVIFEQNYPNGIKSLGPGDRNKAGTAYPMLSLAAPDSTSLGYLTWAGNMACPGANRQCTDSGKLTKASFSSIPGGIAGGTPLVIFGSEPEQPTVVVSPASNFMAATHVYGAGQLSAGVMGSVTSLPAAWSVEFVVSAGMGVTDTTLAWGRGLLHRFNKPAMQVPDDGRDRTVDMLSYYTDNGAAYYYCTEKNKTYADTLRDITAHARGSGIPYRAFQIDSWWYPKGPSNGVTSWTPLPSVFPDGLAPVHEAIDMPFIAHNRYWDAGTPYARQNGGDYDFIVESRLAIPTEERFWVDLLSNATAWGLSVYEQDWLHNEFEGLNATLTSATLGRDWLLQMGRGAEAAEVTIQYCMPYPRHVLQSVEVPAVTQSRASDDYNPQNDQWSLGVSSILYHAVGLAPWKDDTWTSTARQDCPSGTKKYKHDTETAPVLELMVSALTTGPVGPSDLIGSENRTNILRTCTADGVILKPSVPATAIDATFAQRAFGAGGPVGELWSAYSDVTPARFHQVLCASLDSAFSVVPGHLKGFGSAGFRPSPSADADHVAYRYADGAAFASVQAFSATSPVQCAANSKLNPALWHVAPRLMSGHALLGEADKFVAVSAMRFSDLEATQNGFSVRVTGADGETVPVSVLKPGQEGASGVYEVRCVLPPGGSAVLRVPANTCE